MVAVHDSIEWKIHARGVGFLLEEDGDAIEFKI